MNTEKTTFTISYPTCGTSLTAERGGNEVVCECGKTKLRIGPGKKVDA